MQVEFLTKLVALKPGKKVLNMIRNVMQGKDEGADKYDEEDATDPEPIEFLGKVGCIASCSCYLTKGSFCYVCEL